MGLFSHKPAFSRSHLAALGNLALGRSIESAFELSKSEPIEDMRGRRLRIVPGFEGIDLQQHVITLEALRTSWPYYLLAGNIDLEHLTKKGGDSFREYSQNLEKEGFKLPPGAGRNYYEIGRPLEKGFDPETCAFETDIYQGAGSAAAEWFWGTVTQSTPPWTWKPSVQGKGVMVDLYALNDDPFVGSGKIEKIAATRKFRWNNTAMTLEPVNHRVARTTLASTSSVAGSFERLLQKGLSMSDTLSVQEVLRTALLRGGEQALEDLREAGQIERATYYDALSDLAKSLGSLELYGEEIEVAKSFSYGMLAGAAMDEFPVLSPRKIERLAKELLEDREADYHPLSKASGYTPTDEENGFLYDVAEVAGNEFGCSEDDSLLIANRFIELFLASQGK